MILDTTSAVEKGYLTSHAGLFRGERCVIVREDGPDHVWVKLTNSLDPDKEIRVGKDCLMAEPEE